MKKLICFIMATLLAATIFTVPAMADEAIAEVTVILNGEVMVFDAPARIIGNRTMVPLEIVESMYCRFEMEKDKDWEAPFHVFPQDGGSLGLQVGNLVIANDAAGPDQTFTTYDAAPMLMDGHVFIPLRAVCDELGAEIEWSAETETVTVVLAPPKHPIPADTPPEQYPASEYPDVPFPAL